jgi:hypothetical protein
MVEGEEEQSFAREIGLMQALLLSGVPGGGVSLYPNPKSETAGVWGVLIRRLIGQKPQLLY